MSDLNDERVELDEAIRDYQRLFPPPYDLSPNLILARKFRDALGAAEAKIARVEARQVDEAAVERACVAYESTNAFGPERETRVRAALEEFLGERHEPEPEVITCDYCGDELPSVKHRAHIPTTPDHECAVPPAGTYITIRLNEDRPVGLADVRVQWLPVPGGEERGR